MVYGTVLQSKLTAAAVDDDVGAGVVFCDDDTVAQVYPRMGEQAWRTVSTHHHHLLLQLLRLVRQQTDPTRVGPQRPS